MAESKLTFMMLPEEILSLILKTYFASVSPKVWYWYELKSSGGGGITYHPPQFPTIFSILLTCRDLHRLATNTMFETMTIRYDEVSWIGYLVAPSSCRAPTHKFKYIELDELVSPFMNSYIWCWPNLRRLKITTRFGWPQFQKPKLDFLLSHHCPARRVYKSMVDVCESHNVELEIIIKIWLAKYAGTPPDSVLHFTIDKTNQSTLTRAYRLSKANFNKYNTVIETIFDRKAPKLQWASSETPPLSLNLSGDPPVIEWVKPVVFNPLTFNSYGMTVEEATHVDEFE